jgi:flagella basal body P-ring formation protein FlgA
MTRRSLKNFTFISLLVFAAVFHAAVSLAANLTVELPRVIEARDGSFYLGEYAVLDGESEIINSASMAVITPSGGAFSAEDVVEALGATEAAGLSVALRMPGVVRVLPESEAASDLRALTSWKWRIDVEGMEGWDGKFSMPQKVLPGARSLTVKLQEADGRVANKQVKLRWYQPIVYTTRALAKDAKADASSLRLRIGTVGMTNPLAWDAEQLRHATLRKPVLAGEPISFADVDVAAIIRSGSSVKLVAVVKGLGIEVNGIALQRGGIGDVIRVRNLSTRKILSGTVVDAGRVQIGL